MARKRRLKRNARPVRRFSVGELRDKYTELLSEPSAGGALEAAGRAPRDVLSAGAIQDRTESTREELHRIVKEKLGGKRELHTLVDRLAREGARGLDAIASGNERLLAEKPQLHASVEVIVHVDGSRPSFMIKQGNVDLDSSPITTWRDTIAADHAEIRKAIACVGRIDDPDATQKFQGTGFLVHPNIILTNRHVLQEIADWRPGEGWKIRSRITINFGREYKGIRSKNPRKLVRLLYAGPKAILSNAVDHAKLDLAAIELAPAPDAQIPKDILRVEGSRDWAKSGQYTFTIGYPGQPDLTDYPLSLLEKLFKSTFGCKRLAPGRIVRARANVRPWTAAHDTTTLGGNSGSLVVVAGRPEIAAAIHYGGRRADPRENWGHKLGAVMGENGIGVHTTLAEVLDKAGVKLVHST